MEYSSLARSYNALIQTRDLKCVVSAFFQNDEYKDLNKLQLAQVVNDVLFKHYNNEQVLKFRLANEFRNKNYVAAFEVKAKSSRTDFLVINGSTKSFEVKTKLDNLNRLHKQAIDYGDVFEFNTIVVDDSHLKSALKLIPEYYGVWYYQGARRKIYREAAKSPKLCPIAQLGLLTKKEMVKSFKIDNKNQVLANFTSEEINQKLKAALKVRYCKRWDFVKNNWKEIVPIDMQYFFNSNVSPNLVYKD